MSTFRLDVVTPNRHFFSEEVEMVIVRGTEGDLGILKGHYPMVTQLGIARLKIKQAGQWREAAISSGYVEIKENYTIIVTDSAEWPDEIDIDRAEEAMKRAKERLKHGPTDLDLVRAEAALRRAITRIDVANRNK